MDLPHLCLSFAAGAEGCSAVEREMVPECCHRIKRRRQACSAWASTRIQSCLTIAHTVDATRHGDPNLKLDCHLQAYFAGSHQLVCWTLEEGYGHQVVRLVHRTSTGQTSLCIAILRVTS